MTKNIEICKAEEVGAQVLDILGTTAERQAVAAINAAFGLAIPLPANEPGEITELPAAVSAHDRQLLAQTLGKPEPAATLSTTDPLATFVATLTRELYLHLADRQAVYLLADFPDLFARNLAHLLQAVQSLAPRKISNGSATNDGLPDGISLAHLLCDGSAVTTLVDDNSGWTCYKNLPSTLLSIFPNAKDLVIGCTEYNCGSMTGDLGEHSLTFPNMKRLITADNFGINITAKRVSFPELTYWNAYSIKFTHCSDEWLMPKVEQIDQLSALFQYYTGDNITKMQFGPLKTAFRLGWDRDILPNLSHLEFGQGVSANLNLGYWNPSNCLSGDALTTFLQNFRDHIALRLTDQGSGLTLTLSQAVRNAIHAAESTYGIEDIIVNQKHWTLSPAPSA